MHRLAPVPAWPGRAFAGLLYAVNPFVFDRLDTGQWFLLLGYALLPHALKAFTELRGGGQWTPWRFALLAAATGIASSHMAILLALACVSITVAWTKALRGRLGRRVALAAALATTLSLYWLLPTPGIRELWDSVGPAQLALYRTVGDERLGLGVTVAALSGYWNNDDPLREFLPAWPLVFAAVAMLAVYGLALAVRRPAALGIGAAGFAGFALATVEAWGVTRGAFHGLFDAFPPLRSFREPQKGVALLTLAYAYLGAIAVDDLVRSAFSRRVRGVLIVLVLVLPLLGGYRVLGGLWGSLETSQFPRSWYSAERIIAAEAQYSRTLVLPWSGYLRLGFAHGRVVANPAPGFFSSPVLASRSVGDAGASDHEDPVEARIDRLLADGRPQANLAACLSELGVSHVLVLEAPGWASYRHLERLAGFESVLKGHDLVLYRLRTPGGLVMTRDGTGAPCGVVAPLAVRRVHPALYELKTAVREERIVLGLPDAEHWRVSRGEVRYLGWASYRRNYILGLAGVAAFGLSALARARRSRA